jgi:glutaredoxin-like YruB-family protein
MSNITIYTTPYCNFCHAAKHFLEEQKVSYHEKDVSANQDDLNEMIGKTNQMGVPVIDIDGQIIIGFDKAKLEEIIHKK